MKLSYEQRLYGDVQSVLDNNGVDASTHPDNYAELVEALVRFIKAETRRSYMNGLKGHQTRAPRPSRDTRFDIQGKPSAVHAGVLQAARRRPGDAFSAEESLLEGDDDE